MGKDSYRCHVCLKDMPSGIYDFVHHVVFKVLYKVEHALSQSEGCRVPFSCLETVHLSCLIAYPYTEKTKYHIKYKQKSN